MLNTYLTRIVIVFSNWMSKRHFKLNIFKNHTSNLSPTNLSLTPHYLPAGFLISVDNSILLTLTKYIGHATPLVLFFSFLKLTLSTLSPYTYTVSKLLWLYLQITFKNHPFLTTSTATIKSQSYPSSSLT